MHNKNRHCTILIRCILKCEYIYYINEVPASKFRDLYIKFANIIWRLLYNLKTVYLYCH